jgi:hypothetical protein
MTPVSAPAPQKAVAPQPKKTTATKTAPQKKGIDAALDGLE